MPELDSDNQDDLFIWAHEIIDATAVSGTVSPLTGTALPLPDGIMLPLDTVVFPPAISWSPSMLVGGPTCGGSGPSSGPPPSPGPSGATPMGLFWPL